MGRIVYYWQVAALHSSFAVASYHYYPSAVASCHPYLVASCQAASFAVGASYRAGTCLAASFVVEASCKEGTYCSREGGNILPEDIEEAYQVIP